METEIGTALDSYFKWLNDVQELGTLLVANIYLREASEAYEKLQPKVKEKIEFRSFLVGFILASWEKDFQKKKEPTPNLNSGVSFEMSQ